MAPMWRRSGWLVFGALCGTSLVAIAAPPASAPRASPGSGLQAELQKADAQLAKAREHNATLQSQVAAMERHNAEQKILLQQRDAEIAALQQQLQDAGGPPASAGSAGH